MVLPSSENPSKIGFLSRVSHAANEANAPLFSHFQLLLFPILLPKAIATSSCVQMHQHVSVPTSTPAPPGFCWAPAFHVGTLCRLCETFIQVPGSLCPQSFTAHVLPKAAFKSFQYGPSHVGKGLLGDSLFAIMLISALKPPGIRIRKKSSASRNDSSWVCEGAVGGRQTAPLGADYAKGRIPTLHSQHMGHCPFHSHPDDAPMGAVLCGGCLPLPSQ